MLAMNVVAWLQQAVLPLGHPAGIWDMKRWRYRLYAMAGKVIYGGRQTQLLLPEKAPEARLAIELHDRLNHVHQHFKHGNLAA